MGGRKRGPLGMSQLTVRVPKGLAGDLQRLADSHDRSVSSVVRVVLGTFLLRGLQGMGPGEVPSESPEGK